ncbi:MAG: amidohydrolase [Candidatus Omnitrophica bacterium]|nr:amidohydrolase [Candidatus Omnitrophota bacterium]
MIIDAHSHWLPAEIIENAHFFSPAWGDIEAQVEKMEASGIATAVVSYPTSDAHLKLGSISRVSRIYNDRVAGVLKRYPGKFIGAAVLPVENAEWMMAEAKRATGELGFQAISLASSYNGRYLDDEIFHPLYEYVQKHKIPLFIHSQIVNPIGYERVQDPLLTPVVEYVFDMTISIGKLLMSGILRDYPGVSFICAHFGGALPFLRHRLDATYQMLRGINFVKDLGGVPTEYVKNIYVDTGGDTLRSNFLLALELFGPEHVLWGSDWPAKRDVAGAIAAVNELDLSDKDKANILGGNAERLLSRFT